MNVSSRYDNLCNNIWDEILYNSIDYEFSTSSLRITLHDFLKITNTGPILQFS